MLAVTGWFSEQPEDFRERMLALANWRTYRAGEDLYEVGDEPNGVFGLENGELDIAVPLSDDEMVVLHRAQPGFWIGDSALLAETKRGLSVVARVESLVLSIPARPLLRHLSERPEDIVYFYRLNHAKIMLTLKVLVETVALPPRSRFARMLLRLATKDGRVNATQTELGAMAGMSRAAFRRSFAELIEARIVRTEYGGIRILDRRALEDEAERQ
ncbi:Crp/Fnr family transcriptional regulator [Tropicimonas aquimaris]|uniref:Crp/Fnr family transcriptional regulator n=1 Tax=Tropicimonas aquimaris TaxID=914152 RepID=A0ABW3IR53_9RHOB